MHEGSTGVYVGHQERRYLLSKTERPIIKGERVGEKSLFAFVFLLLFYYSLGCYLKLVAGIKLKFGTDEMYL